MFRIDAKTLKLFCTSMKKPQNGMEHLENPIKNIFMFRIGAKTLKLYCTSMRKPQNSMEHLESP